MAIETDLDISITELTTTETDLLETTISDMDLLESDVIKTANGLIKMFPSIELIENKILNKISRKDYTHKDIHDYSELVLLIGKLVGELVAQLCKEGCITELEKLLNLYKGTLKIPERVFNNDIGLKIIVLAKVLIQNTTITNLIISCNNISDVGAELFASNMAQYKSLKSLDLSYNLIGDVGATLLSVGLTQNRSITMIDLRYNNITKNGFAVFNTVRAIRPELQIYLE